MSAPARSQFARGPLWRPACYLQRGAPPEAAYVVVWRTAVMPAPAFWYFPGTPLGKRQAWAARRRLEARWAGAKVEAEPPTAPRASLIGGSRL